MVALPAAMAFIVPLDTVATAVLLLLHVTFWLVALDGATVANKVSEPPKIMVVDVLFKATPVTGILVSSGSGQAVIVQAITARIEIIPNTLPLFFIQYSFSNVF